MVWLICHIHVRAACDRLQQRLLPECVRFLGSGTFDCRAVCIWFKGAQRAHAGKYATP